MGEYRLVKDTVSPEIILAKNIAEKWISDRKTIHLTISDDLSGIKSYEGYLNGKWILLEYWKGYLAIQGDDFSLFIILFIIIKK